MTKQELYTKIYQRGGTCELVQEIEETEYMVHTAANLIRLFETGQEAKGNEIISNLIEESEYFGIFGDESIVAQEQ